MCQGEGPHDSTEPLERAELKESCRVVEVRATTWAVCKIVRCLGDLTKSYQQHHIATDL